MIFKECHVLTCNFSLNFNSVSLTPAQILTAKIYNASIFMTLLVGSGWKQKKVNVHPCGKANQTRLEISLKLRVLHDPQISLYN